MRDIRQAPFTWQSVNATSLLRAMYSGKKRTTAIAIYQAMTEVANSVRSGKFKAARAELADYAGVTSRTLDDYAAEFQDAGLIAVTKTRNGRLNDPNTWELLEPPMGVKPVHPDGGEANSTLNQQQALVVDTEAVAVPEVKKKVVEDGSSTSSVDSVFNFWVERTNPRNKTLSPSRKRTIERALNERSVDECKEAILGLIAWQHSRGGGLELSRVFQSRPGGSPLGEQIDWFIEQGKKAAITGSGIPSVDPAVIARRKQDVQRGHRQKGDPVSVRKAEEAEAWLRQIGIEVVRGDDGFPTFRSMSGSLE